MVDARSLRSNPRPSSKGAALKVITRLGERRRARSVPIDFTAESEGLLAAARSLKRKRIARKAMAEEDMSPVPATQPVAGSSKDLSAVSLERNAGGLSVQEIGLLTPAPSQSQFTSRPNSYRKDGPASSRKEKGKRKADTEEPHDYASENEVTGSPSTPLPGRPTKRRRIDRPEDRTVHTDDASQTPTWLELLLDPQEWTQPDDDAHAEADAEASFHLFDVADVTALPNVPVDPAIHREAADPATLGTMYVPPAVARLLETMHHALATERRARQRAEALHAFEHARRQKLEAIAVALRQKNVLLEVEARAWAARTALATSDPSAFAALGLSVDGQAPAAPPPSGPVDVWSLPQIRPAPAGAPSPSFTLVDTSRTGSERERGASDSTAVRQPDPRDSS